MREKPVDKVTELSVVVLLVIGRSGILTQLSCLRTLFLPRSFKRNSGMYNLSSQEAEAKGSPVQGQSGSRGGGLSQQKQCFSLISLAC